MKKIDNIIKSIALLILFVVVVGCTKQQIEHDVIAEGEVPIFVNMGGIYSSIPATKADAHSKLTSGMIHNLPDGSTLRLIVLKKGDGETEEAFKKRILNKKVIQYSDVADACIRTVNGKEDIGYTYVIQTSNNEALGGQSLIPCTLTYDEDDADNDNDKTEITGITEGMMPYTIPVTGTAQTFYCVAISPAKKLIRENRKLLEQNNSQSSGSAEDTLKVTVRNQDTFLSSNNHWTQTQFSTFTVPDNVSEPAVITLNPLMQTTARIKVTIESGDFISSLRPGEPTIEIDRVPTEPGDSWLVDKDDDKTPDTPPQDEFTNHILNLSICDTIAPQMGNNILYNRMYVQPENCTVDTVHVEVDDDVHKHVTDMISIVARTTVLPMDARPTPMIIRLNLFVNDVPMQFQYQTGKNFLAGHSYDYKATISLHKNEMYIATWQDVAWKTDVYPGETVQ